MNWKCVRVFEAWDSSLTYHRPYLQWKSCILQNWKKHIYIYKYIKYIYIYIYIHIYIYIKREIKRKIWKEFIKETSKIPGKWLYDRFWWCSSLRSICNIKRRRIDKSSEFIKGNKELVAKINLYTSNRAESLRIINQLEQ